MEKQNKYRFNLAFDETDEDHCRVCEFLNQCGRKKARYIVKAILAYWSQQENPQHNTSQYVQRDRSEVKLEKTVESIEDGKEYGVEQKEIDLMRKNFEIFENWE